MCQWHTRKPFIRDEVVAKVLKRNLRCIRILVQGLHLLISGQRPNGVGVRWQPCLVDPALASCQNFVIWPRGDLSLVFNVLCMLTGSILLSASHATVFLIQQLDDPSGDRCENGRGDANDTPFSGFIPL